MKLKFRLFIIMLLAIISCKEETGDSLPPPTGDQETVWLSRENQFERFTISSEGNNTYSISVARTGDGKVDFQCSLVESQQVLDDYNEQNGTVYQAMPAECFTLSPSSFQYEEGEKSKTLVVEWNMDALKEALNTSSNYVLPLELQVSDNTTTIDKAYSSIILAPQIPTPGYQISGIKDLALIYQGGTHRIDWTEEQFVPYVTHTFADGSKEWLFDGFLFLEFTSNEGFCFANGYSGTSANKDNMLWLLDRIFEEGKALSALDACIEKQIAELGEPPFTHRIVLSIPEVQPGKKDWGELDGKTMDLESKTDQLAVTRWYIDELIRRFNAANYTHLVLDGFYWLAESATYTGYLPAPVSSYIHDKGYTFCWIPYWGSEGSTNWREMGFDIAYQQPNHFFEQIIPDTRLDKACELAHENNMGLELEFDERALYDQNNGFYQRLVAYVDHFEQNGVFSQSSIAYYSGYNAMIDMSQSTHPKDQEIMDRLCRLIVDRRTTLGK